MDVHQATIVATARDEHGGVVMRATLRTEAKAILAFVRGLGSTVHLAFEEGCQAQWLHDLLVPHVERVMVCNVRGKSARDNKSDRVDADELSEQLRVGALKGVYHGASSVLTLKELVRSYTNLVEDATRVMQRIKALFRARGIATPGVSVYRPAQRKAWLAKLDGRGARLRAEMLLRELDVILERQGLALRRMPRVAVVTDEKRLEWKRASGSHLRGLRHHRASREYHTHVRAHRKQRAKLRDNSPRCTATRCTCHQRSHVLRAPKTAAGQSDF